MANNEKKRKSTSEDDLPAAKRPLVDSGVEYEEQVWKASSHYDALKHQQEHGWAVFKSVVSSENLLKALDALWTELGRLSPEFNKEKTLRELTSLLPPNNHHIFQNFRLGLIQEVVDIKYSEEVQHIFRLIWKVYEDELMSAGRDNIAWMTPKLSPNGEKMWPHLDQSPQRQALLQPQGASCIQGFIVATHDLVTDPTTGRKNIRLIPHRKELGGLHLLKDSHKKFHQVYKKLGITKTPIDWYKFKDEESKGKDKEKPIKELYEPELDEKGNVKWIIVEAEPGDLVVWDSRMVHFAMRPQFGQNAIRVALYICMMPSKFATPKQLEKEWIDFKNKGCSTTHWPYGGKTVPDKARYRGIADKERVDAFNSKINFDHRPILQDYRLFGAPYKTGDSPN